MSARPSTNFPLTGPLRLGGPLGRAFRFYRARFGLFLLTAAVFLVPTTILSGLFLESVFANSMRAIDLLAREAPGPDFNPFAFIFDRFGGVFGGLLIFSAAC